MNTPDNIEVGNHRDTHIQPRLLMPEYFRYHLATCGLKHNGQPVVMWTQGSTKTEGYAAGTHDGIRDGAFAGSTDMRHNFVHYCTQEDWVNAGNSLVADLPDPAANLVRELLTFAELPSDTEITQRAEMIASVAADMSSGEDRGGIGFALQAMIGGAPFFMSALEQALRDVGIQPVYAFSIRESVEKTDSSGKVTKTNVFKHIGFIEM